MMRRISRAGSNSGMGSFQRLSALRDLPYRLATENAEGLIDSSPVILIEKGMVIEGP